MPPKKEDTTESTEVSQENTKVSEVEESTDDTETPKVEAKSDMQKLTEMVEAQAKQIDILTKSADKTQLARHTPKDTIGKSIRVGVIEGKLVVKWELLSNIVRYDKRGDHVDQKGDFTLEDDMKVPYTIETFRDLLESKWVDVDLNKCKFRFDEKGNRREIEIYSFKWKGKDTELSSTFVNP